MILNPRQIKQNIFFFLFPPFFYYIYLKRTNKNNLEWNAWMLCNANARKKKQKKRRKMEEKCVLHYFSWIWNQDWSYYLYITCLCTLFSLDELILLHFTSLSLFSLDELILLHFTSLSFVMHVVWELFIVFVHMILILKSRAFDCWTWT